MDSASYWAANALRLLGEEETGRLIRAVLSGKPDGRRWMREELEKALPQGEEEAWRGRLSWVFADKFRYAKFVRRVAEVGLVISSRSTSDLEQELKEAEARDDDDWRGMGASSPSIWRNS